MKADKQNKAFYWATTFMRELFACGISDFVISPGSRSTPLTVAAAVHPGLKTHVVLDEQSAGFLALGMAKSSGQPAGLICTSGTAAANYFSAVIEARHSGVPLLVLTADRPPHLRNIGASQAIDQIKLFGNYPVFFHETGEPVLETEDLNRLKTVASQGISTSITRKGPAHINFPFRKPLEPDPAFVNKIELENKQMLSEELNPRTRIYHSTDSITIPDKIQSLLENSTQPVVIEGPYGTTSDEKVTAAIANKLNAPLLAEFPALSHANLISGFDGFLKNESIRKELTADLILRFGQQPVSKALHLYLKQLEGIPHIHFGELEEWQDATHTVTDRIIWNKQPINWQLDFTKTNTNWLEKWKTADQKFAGYKNDNLGNTTELTDGAVFQDIGTRIPKKWNVVLSNSFPVRDWMLFAGSPPHTTFTNRGASGIDGIISTAIGVTMNSEKPTVLFIGDLATLHDSNALMSAKFLDHPLFIVLLNNNGGNIFRMLPIHKHKNIYTDYFETPQDIEFESLAETHNLSYMCINTIDQLKSLPFEDLNEPGIHLVECRTDPNASMKQRHALWNFSD